MPEAFFLWCAFVHHDEMGGGKIGKVVLLFFWRGSMVILLNPCCVLKSTFTTKPPGCRVLVRFPSSSLYAFFTTHCAVFLSSESGTAQCQRREELILPPLRPSRSTPFRISLAVVTVLFDRTEMSLITLSLLCGENKRERRW